MQACEHCGKLFQPRKPRGRFCGRSCASAGSVTDKRRQASRLSGLAHCRTFSSQDLAKSLESREGWKYQALAYSLMVDHHQRFQFEFPLGPYVFDLALSGPMLLVEFDSIYHKRPKQASRDRIKDEYARAHGWRVKRVPTLPGKIPESALAFLKGEDDGMEREDPV